MSERSRFLTAFPYCSLYSSDRASFLGRVVSILNPFVSGFTVWFKLI